MNEADKKYLEKEGFKVRTWLNLDERTKYENSLKFSKLEPPAEKDGKFKLKQMEE